MINDSVEKCITGRLGKLLTCTACHILYWNNDAHRFVFSGFYNYLLWYGAYVQGLVYSLLVFLTVLSTIYDVEIPDEQEGDDTEKTIKEIHTYIGIAISVIVATIMIVVSQMKNRKYELVQSINGLFAFNDAMKVEFKDELTRETFNTPENIRFGILVFLVSKLSLFVPVVFVVGLFHPAEPTHQICKLFLEIEIGLNWESVPIILWLWWGALLTTNTVTTMLLIGATAIFSPKLWCHAIMPEGPSEYRRFQTRQLGTLTEDRTICFYRSLQLLCNQMNHVFGGFRITLHSGAMLIVFALMAFVEIRYVDYFLESPATMVIGMTVLGAVVLPLIIYYFECTLIHGLIEASNEFMDVIAKSSGRKSYVFKATYSLQPLVIKTSAPFYGVGNDTFLEWCNTAVDILVNLLVTF